MKLLRTCILASALIGIVAGQRRCFVPNGTNRHDLTNIGNNKYEPCESNGHSMCCNTATGDKCQSNGLCWNEGGRVSWRESCTDPTWQSPKCLKLCVSDDAATGTDGGPMTGSDVVVTKCGNEDVFCCGNDQEARECCEAGRGVRVVNGQVVAASSTTSTQPTFATSTPDNEAGGTTASQAAVIGGTVGAIIGVMTLAAVVVFLWLRGWKRKARMVQPTEPTQVVTDDMEDKNAAYDSMLPGSQHFDGPGTQYHLAELPEDHSQPG
ncbi:hypothetical protein CTRI78_v001851 [Colletotrichum trifolii]|uniref:Mid2 domain-containing protein n=1 Tax=Colletotrichum trifolii TaxID=5466 RepID=A0A4R8RNG3_COLTR|nr:hypothetical protein CTRI78_v001851 [Colletotrichum trifolii]